MYGIYIYIYAYLKLLDIKDIILEILVQAIGIVHSNTHLCHGDSSLLDSPLAKVVIFLFTMKIERMDMGQQSRRIL